MTSIGNYAFSGCEGITSTYFYGDAPDCVSYSIFGYRDSSFTVYHLASASGWPAEGELWNGYKTAIFTLN